MKKETERLAIEFLDCVELDAIPSINDIEKAARHMRALQSHLEELNRKVEELEKDCCQLIDDRDERDEVIDALLIQVLGNECKEWSSAYDFNDAVIDVECKMKSLEKDVARYRWIRRNVGVYRTNDGKGPVSPYLLIQVPAKDLIAEETDIAIDTAMQSNDQ